MGAATLLRPFLFCSILVSIFLFTSAQTCRSYTFEGKKTFESCNDLPYLNSFLHYTYNASMGTLQLAYRHTEIKHSNWVSWAINLEGSGMIGGQALVAYVQKDSTLVVYTSILTNYRATLMKYPLRFPVTDLYGTYIDNEIVIFANLQLLNNKTIINHVWQDGPLVNDGIAGMHETSPSHMLSKGILDLISGQLTMDTTKPANKDHKRHVHALLNVVGWGLMIPIGTMLTRYVRLFEAIDPSWFYLHVAFQTVGYIIGVIGWVLGMQLWNETHRDKSQSHGILGITLFCLATLQMLSLIVRPTKEHKYRCYWNIYHHLVGYAVIIMAMINISKGFGLLSPTKEWMKEYFSTIFVLFLIGVFMEVYICKLVSQGNRDKAQLSCNKPNLETARLMATTAGIVLGCDDMYFSIYDISVFLQLGNQFVNIN